LAAGGAGPVVEWWKNNLKRILIAGVYHWNESTPGLHLD
jgi:hypothetical protein